MMYVTFDANPDTRLDCLDVVETRNVGDSSLSVLDLSLDPSGDNLDDRVISDLLSKSGSLQVSNEGGVYSFMIERDMKSTVQKRYFSSGIQYHVLIPVRS